MNTTRKIAVGMSGGVDSSTAAYLLRERGHEVIGLTARLWTGGRAEAPVVEEAAAVAHFLGIPHQVLEAQMDFRRWIIEPFLRQYVSGRTPSPCILCNQLIKFGILFRHAQNLGCDAVATGHYVIAETDDRGVHLKRGLDPDKEQSYFLHRLNREQLEHAVFPLGTWIKEKVRAFAKEHQLPVRSPTESQDLCFVENGKLAEFIETHKPGNAREGEIVNEAGDVLGAHRGLHFFTVGQRKGLGIASTEPWYVQRLDAENNRVIVARQADASRAELTAADFNWIEGEAPGETVACTAQIRYRHDPAPCRADVLEEHRVRVVFKEPQFAVTPGQAVVLYDGDEVLGGGWIE